MQTQKVNAALIYQYVLNESLIIQNILKEEPSDKMFVDLIGELSTTTFWGSSTGHLHKLHMYYSHILAQGENSLCDIKIALNLTLKTAKQCQHALLNDLACPFLILKQMLYNITFIFIQKIELYAKNHYVLFFLLRKHQEIDAIYGEGTVNRIFESLFSKGIDEASQYLLSQFSNHGYTHLIPTINEHFNMISRYES